MSSFQLVKTMNTAFGNPEGDPTNLNWERIEKQISNVQDENNETLRAIDAKDLDQVRDGLCDIKVFVHGAIHFMGADAEAAMEATYSRQGLVNPASVAAAGDPLNVQWDGLRDLLSIVPSNFAVAMRAVARHDQDEVISALCAILVGVDHAFRFIGIDGEEDMGVVVDAVMTRFCKHEAQLDATKAKYNALRVEFYIEGVFPTVCLKSSKDQKDKNRDNLPKGKFLKAEGFKEPVFRQYRGAFAQQS